jgi:Phosphodiester glycosidase
MVYSNQRFSTLSFFSRSALLVERPYNHLYSILKLFILVLFFLSAPVNVFLLDSPLVGKLFALSNQNMVLLSSGVVLRSEILQTQAGQVMVHMLYIDLTQPRIHMGIVQAHNKLISSGETISNMAKRSGALAGINGDFFEAGNTNRPIGMEVINGQMMQSPSMYAVFGTTTDDRITVSHETFNASITVGSASFKLSSINHLLELHEGKLGLITPALGASIPVRGDTVVMLRRDMRSLRELIVLSMQHVGKILPPLTNRYALVGRGRAGAWLRAHLHKGVHVIVNEQIFPDNNLFQALGGGLVLIKNGARYLDHALPVLRSAYSRNPLTAIGISRDGKHAFIVVFDGRYSSQFRSRGVTSSQAASFLLSLGAYQAMMFDGGASSEMVTRFPGRNKVSVVSYPSGGGERPLANGLFVYT